MTGGIVTLLALLGFVAVVIWVFGVKRREDFEEQARQPLKDQGETNRQKRKQDGSETPGERRENDGENDSERNEAGDRENRA